MSYRKILECVRIKIPAKHYEIEHLVVGNIPQDLSRKLPIFSSENGEEIYVNSGGRSIIVENRGEVYRIKGADPKGIITRLVASSDKNMIADIRQSLSACPNPSEIEKILVSKKNCEFPCYKQDRPFNFLIQEAVEKSRQAFEALRRGYEQAGFSHPCIFRGYIAYKNVRWQGRPVRSIIFHLTNVESDLREDELTRYLQKHLQHASVEQIDQVGKKLVDFYTKLLRWYAFDCRILVENGLLPTQDSMIGQNYVIGNVSQGNVGIARVDHTSTQKTNLDEKELLGKISKFSNILIMSMSHIPLALEMAERGVQYDKDRFSNYYDAAFKFHEVNYLEWPKTLRFLNRMGDEFDSAYRTAQPQAIPETELINIFNDTRAIRIDEEFERKREERYKQVKEELAKKGITPEMLAQMIARK